MSEKHLYGDWIFFMLHEIQKSEKKAAVADQLLTAQEEYELLLQGIMDDLEGGDV